MVDGVVDVVNNFYDDIYTYSHRDLFVYVDLQLGAHML